MNRALVVIAAFVMVVGCNRANPRLTKVTDGTSVTKLTYDKDGHPSQVDVDDGTFTQSYALTFDGAKVTKAVLTSTFGGGPATTSNISFTYDGNNRLTQSHTEDPGGGSHDSTLAYDGSGRLTTVTSTVGTGAAEITSTSTITYAADGTVSKSEQSDSQGGKVTDTQSSAFTFKDGKLSVVTIASNAGNGTFTAKYDGGGALQSIDVNIESNDNGTPHTDQSTRTYKYDDKGRMSSIQDADEKLDVTLAYEDGDAADLDVTPVAALSFLWDLAGHSWPAPDARTQAPRFAGLTW